MAPKIEQLGSLLGRAEEFFNNLAGSVEIVGADAQRAQSLARQMQLAFKEDTFANLGVLAGPDLSILEAVIPNMSGLRAGATAAIIGDVITPALEEFRRSYENMRELEYSVHGFVPNRGFVSNGSTASDSGNFEIIGVRDVPEGGQ